MCACLLFLSCTQSDDLRVNSLGSYIDEHKEWLPFDQLVACAAGGQSGFLDDPEAPLSMFFYPKLYSTNFRYYETVGSEQDSGDLNVFLAREDVGIEPLFNGFMARFPLAAPGEDKWARVSFVSNDTLWYCKPVRIKYHEKPSLFDPNLVAIDIDQQSQPSFAWEQEDDLDNIIYFQIVVDQRGDALSATYTTDKNWSYYNLQNVVFNVTRPGPTLPLEANKTFDFILMGISEDNWVNTLSKKTFVTTP